jgi:hypothetical protein
MEVPVSYVKANQIGIVLFVAAALVLRQPWLLLCLWAVQTAGLFTGGRWNVFVWAAKRIVGAGGTDTQSFELTRFNNTLAVLFLTLSLFCYLFGFNVAGAVFALLLLGAAGAALFGYCIGCTVYFQFKQWKARRNRK